MATNMGESENQTQQQDPNPAARVRHKNKAVPTVRRVETEAEWHRQEHLYDRLDEALLRGFTRHALAVNDHLGKTAEAVEVRIKDVELFLKSPEEWTEKT